MNRIVKLFAALALIVSVAACTASESPTPVESQAVSTALGEGPKSSSEAVPALAGDLPQGENLLFALQAGSGTLEATDEASTFTLTLSDASERTTWFSDRPVRDGGTIATGTLVQQWSALGFDADPPNAVLSIAGKESQPDLVIELISPSFEEVDRRLTMGVRVVGMEGADDVAGTFKEVSLFIDDASLPSSCLFAGEVDFFPFERDVAFYAPADGRSLGVAQYPELFAALGNRFGGDAETFNLPTVADLVPGVKAMICTTGADPSVNGPDAQIDTTCTVGKVQLFAQEQAVYGYALADGQELPITSRLFKYAGTTFGGDGVETFATPSIPAPPGLSQQVCTSGYFQWSQDTSDQSPTTMADVSYWATMNAQAPEGWEEIIPREELQVSQQSALFALMGTTFGGDGKTYFQLPTVGSPVPGVNAKIAFEGIFPQGS